MTLNRTEKKDRPSQAAPQSDGRRTDNLSGGGGGPGLGNGKEEGGTGQTGVGGILGDEARQGTSGRCRLGP